MVLRIGNEFGYFLVLGGLDCFMDVFSFIGLMVLGFCPWVSLHQSRQFSHFDRRMNVSFPPISLVGCTYIPVSWLISFFLFFG